MHTTEVALRSHSPKALGWAWVHTALQGGSPGAREDSLTAKPGSVTARAAARVLPQWGPPWTCVTLRLGLPLGPSKASAARTDGEPQVSVREGPDTFL